MTKKRKESFKVYLDIDGFGDDPQVVTDLLKLEPSEVMLKGQLVGGGVPRKFSSWKYDSTATDREFVDEHIIHILEKAKNMNLLKSNFPEISALIQVVVYTDAQEQTPVITLDEKLMKLMIEKGFFIDIAVY